MRTGAPVSAAAAFPMALLAETAIELIATLSFLRSRRATMDSARIDMVMMSAPAQASSRQFW